MSKGRTWRDYILPRHEVTDPDGSRRMIWTYDPHPTKELFLVEERTNYVITRAYIREVPRALANDFAHTMGERSAHDGSVAVFWCFSCSHAAEVVKDRQRMIGFDVQANRYTHQKPRSER